MDSSRSTQARPAAGDAKGEFYSLALAGGIAGASRSDSIGVISQTGEPRSS